MLPLTQSSKPSYEPAAALWSIWNFGLASPAPTPGPSADTMSPQTRTMPSMPLSISDPS